MKNNLLKLSLVIFIPFLFTLCNPMDDLGIPTTDEYFVFRAPGNEFNLATPDSVTYTRSGSSNVIVSYNSSGSINAYVSFDGPQSPGQYTATYISIFNNGNYFVPHSTQKVSVKVDAFGGPAQHITGTYLGAMKDSATNGLSLVTGSFKVRNQ